MPVEIFNFPFAARLDQSKDPKQLDVGFTALSNVAFDYDGALSKRPGLQLAWNGGSTSYDEPHRLIQVGKTLAMIGGAAPTSVSLDSQMGNVSLYSDKLDSWAGSVDWLQQVSPAYVEREDIAASLDSSLVDGDVCYCNGYIVQAWIRRGIEVTTFELEVCVRVIDAVTGTVRSEQIYDALSGDDSFDIRALKCTKAATVNIVMVTWIRDDDEEGSVWELRRALINLTSTAPSFGVAGNLITDVETYYDVAPGPVAGDDQQWIVAAEVGTDVHFYGFSSAAANVHTYAETEDKFRPSVTTVSGTDVAIAWVDGAAGDIECRVYTQSGLDTNTPIATGEGGADTANIRDTAIVHMPTIGTNDVLVAWTYETASPISHVLGWARTDHDEVGPVGAVSRVRRLRLYSHIIMHATRAYVCVADADDEGATWPNFAQRRLHWVNLPIAINDDSPAFRPIPVAPSQTGLPSPIFGRPGVLRTITQDTGSSELGRYYQAVVTQHPVVGTISSAFVQAQQQVTIHLLSGNKALSDFGRTVQIGGQSYTAGGYVSQFDDVRFFENGFLQVPAVRSVTAVNDATGAVAENTYDIKVVYEFLDDSDQIAFSLECGGSGINNIDQVAVVAPNDAVDVVIEPLTLTLKQQKFYNARKVRLGVYVRTGNNEYRRWLDHSAVTLDVDELNNPESLTARTLRFKATPSTTAPPLYTNNNARLQTDVIPSCTTICAHKNRLWASGGEFGGVIYYSLEWREGEPISFALQQFLDIPEARIVALASLDEVLYAFSEDGIWSIFGDGPDDTGAPTTGSFQVARLTSDVGMQWPRCWAIGRDGIYFVGRKGFYLLTRSRTIQYLGAPVETTFDTVFDFRSAVVNDARHEVRFYCQASGIANYCIVLDYETGAWATWTYIPPSDGVSIDALLWNGEPTLLTTGSASVIGKVYQDATTYRDDGAFYAMSITTGEVRFGRPLELKRFQRMSLLYNRAAGNGGIQFDVTVPGRSDLGTHTNTWTEAQLDALTTKDRVRMHIRDQKYLGWTIGVTELEPTAVPVFTTAMRWSGLAFEVRPVGKLGRASDAGAR